MLRMKRAVVCPILTTCLVAAPLGLVGGLGVEVLVRLVWGARLAEGSPWYVWMLASTLTWLFLLRYLRGRWREYPVVVGVISVPLGSIAWYWLVTMRALALGEISASFWRTMGDLLVAIPTAPVTGTLVSWPVSMPVGIGTAVVMRHALRRWCP